MKLRAVTILSVIFVLTIASPRAARPPKPDPDKGHIVLRVRAPESKANKILSLGMANAFKRTAAVVYFAKLDESADAYAVDGVVWPNYSWMETTYFVRNAKKIIHSNFSGKGRVYLLNADPGRYVALGGVLMDFGGPNPKAWDAAFTNELSSQSEIDINPGEFVLVGDFMSSKLNTRTAFSAQLATLSMIYDLKAEYFASGNFAFRPSTFALSSVATGEDVVRETWKDAEKTLKKEPAWLSLSRRTAERVSEPRQSETELARISQEAYASVCKQKLAEAADAAEQAVELAQTTFGPEHPRVAAHLANLALIHRYRGARGRAETAFLQALEVREKALGQEHPAVAHSLLSLVALYQASSQREFERALPLAERAVAIRERALGADHLDTAIALTHLAHLYLESGQLERAVSAQESATKIGEKELGAESLEFATFLHNLGTAYGAADSPEKALPVLERALMIREELSGPNSRPVAETLLSIAQLHRRNGEFERALPLVERVVEIYGEAPDSWMLADLLMINAQYRQLLGAPTSDVRALMARSVDIRSRGMTRQLTLGSEEENILYVGSVGAGQINGVLSFQPEESGGDPDSTRLALTTLLQWKGRVLDSSAGSLMRLRRRLEPEDQTLLVELTQVREELSELATSGALMTKARIKEAEKLAARARDLEATLAERSAEFRLRTRPVALDEIQKRLPENAALVEIARFRPVVFEAKSRDDWYGAPRYVAYVLRQSGEPSWVALGGGAEIDRLAASFRAAVGGPGLEEFGTQARALYDAIFKPLLPLIGDAEHLLLSPDGALHLVPFGALLDEDDHFLIEDYLLSYLDSGRDLARLKLSAKAREGAWIVAAPDFDAGAVPEDAATTVVQADTPLRSGDYRDMFFEPLAGTNDEAKAIHTLLPNASIRLDDEATEELLKARHGPSILHIATHGFFLDDQDLSADKSPARGLTLSAPFGGETDFSSEPIVENPLLRSGVALAGANRRSTRGEDGVLTALEASGLDLDGTRLVVLSACDTGLGDLRNSEGVFGLRRAFVLAGAESQVMSLWRVDDEATRNLMVDFYTCLAAGQGRAEALRRAQIQMLRDEERSHPFYWAAFIQSGAWRPLKGITKR